MASKSLKEKISKFVEQEQNTPTDQQLLDELRIISHEDTLYWTLTPDKRNALNQFFRELHDEITGAELLGKYGANILIDAVIVTAFETGYQLRGRGHLIEGRQTR